MREQESVINDLLGLPGESAHERRAREMTMGNIPYEKALQLKQLNRDFDEVRSMQTGRAATPQEARDLVAILQQEYARDLAALLTPEELRQYNLRQSPSATVLMGKTAGIDLTENEYEVLYALQEKKTQAHPLPNVADLAALEAERTAQFALDQSFRAILG